MAIPASTSPGGCFEQGENVITLTNSSSRANPFGGRVRAFPFHFERPDLLVQHLKDVSVLYNTYWVRFGPHADAVRNTLALFEAAKEAGVERIVHVSITNPSEDSPLEYFRGKAKLEKALVNSGISYAILRPAVLFGKEDILINNIAWTLRHLPVFGVFGDGRYRLQPIYVDDLASLAVEQGKSRANVDRQCDRAGDVCLSRTRGDDRPIDRQAASHRVGSALARLCRESGDGQAGRRRGDYPGRDPRTDGRTALRGRSSRGNDSADRMGERHMPTPWGESTPANWQGERAECRRTNR